MVATLSELFDLLPECQIADRFPLRKQLEKASRADQIDPERLKALAQRLEQSIARVEAREALPRQIDYPDLPVAERREELLKVIRDNQVVVIAGETGSGKTTQIPKLCLELGLGCKGMIGHTQPRRLAARNVAARIAEELQTPLGERVGYQVRFHDQVSEQTQIKLMTDGILLAETQNDRFLDRYEVLIIDEAHERSLNIDFLLGYIKRILPQRPSLKLIITSATIDLEKFSRHFAGAPVIEVSGRTYPVKTLYRPLHEMEGDDEKAMDLQQGILQAVEEIADLDRQTKNSGARDILVFLPGEREIRETADQLRKAVSQGRLRDLEVIPLYARLSVKEQNRVFHGQRGAGRRIVLSTNVAETSLTVPGIRYVIDPGLARVSRYSYRSKVQRLPIEAISQASANQRAGRCGRIAPGTCIRLYSEEDFLSRPAFTDAEIRRTNLAAVILQMLQLKLGDIARFPFIDPPDSRFINDGFKLLEELGAVDGKRRMTSIGRQLARLPVDPRIGRMVIEASQYDALKEVLIIASALSVQDPRERPHDKRQAADEKHKAYQDDQSDFMTLLNLWNLFEEQRQALSQNQLRQWCQKHFISFMRMREWRDIHRQLHLSIREMKLRENSEPAEYTPVHRSLLAGLLSHIGNLAEKGEYLGARNRRFRIFPGSGLFKKSPKWVMAAELIETSKLYAHQVARIEPQWIEQPAEHLVKRSWSEPHWEKKRAQVVANEQVSLFGLVIVPKRKVNFGKVDPIAAHEIFLRSALVEGEFETRADFFRRNRALLDSVESMESKTRRRDLLVDEETLYQFYAGKFDALGGGHVVNGAGFEKWYKGVKARDPNALILTEDDVLQRSAEHVNENDYPEQLPMEGVKLKLDYLFDPSAETDGVSVEVPLPLLKSLPVRRLEWLVPGMLEEKVTSILKGLPKQHRKHFVPVPDYARSFCEVVTFGEGDLYEALSHHLLRASGHRIDPVLLRESHLEPHLRFNIALLDSKGKTLGQGRDWESLNKRFAKQAEEAIQKDAAKPWGGEGITRWDFGVLEPSVRVRQAGGLEVEAFPGLVDMDKSVTLRLFSSADEARYQTRLGVARLLALSVPEQLKTIRRQLPHMDKVMLLTAKRFDRRRLEDDLLIRAIIRAADVDQLPSTVTEADFESARTRMLSVLEREAHALVDFVMQCHQWVHEIDKRLNGRVDLVAVPVLNDIKGQLSRLIFPGYLSQTEDRWLTQLPRYLEAIHVRLEKFQRDIRLQTLQSTQLESFEQRYKKRLEEARARDAVTDELRDFRWWIEEYRVSLFAQQLGTLFSVSEKRLNKRLEELI
ncbi:ATP-dependent RNA helicase HrpA [Marinobacterium litorale]|uniref:ATP-dependent RNA helicase HrpA n=1 Tax=Marinobacterium litorale TaxID=404770 RepID=UPI0003FFC399|nr:ATP-dependent RNA helicase HrpA [Marinobacterium litorale]